MQQYSQQADYNPADVSTADVVACAAQGRQVGGNAALVMTSAGGCICTLLCVQRVLMHQ